MSSPAIFRRPPARVRFFGDDITAMPAYERIRAGLRRTYQSSLLFRELTVRDNLFLAVRGVARGRFSLLRPRAASTTRRAAEDLLERVRLTEVGDERVAVLSHGQQRQLEIGMALAGAPRLILFDEPAAGLSPGERRELVALLRALPAHMGFVLIEHDLDIALRVVDRVSVLHNGRLLKEGTPAEIENDAEVQAIYMGDASLMRWFFRRADARQRRTCPLLAVENLDVHYGRAHALQEVSLTLERGVRRRRRPQRHGQDDAVQRDHRTGARAAAASASLGEEIRGLPPHAITDAASATCRRAVACGRR